MKELKTNLESAIQAYIDAFCKKHNLEFGGWVDGASGTHADFSGIYVFSFDDIRWDIECDIPVNWIVHWDDYRRHISEDISYKTWITLNI